MRLPEGRGLRRDQDAAVNQGESDAVRRRLLPDQDGWVISPLGDLLQANMETASVSLTASRLYLFWLPDAAKVTGVMKARLRVTTVGLAGTTVKAALYKYDSSQTSFTKIPGTDATFPGDSLGVKTVTLGRQVQVSNLGRTCLGVVASSGTIAVEGMLSGNVGRLFNNYYGVSTGLDNNLKLSTLTADLTADTPLVLYLSQAASLVL